VHLYFICEPLILFFFVKSGRIQLKKSGTRVPRVELEEVGPSADLVLRRTKIASDDLYRRAKKQPDAAKVWILFVQIFRFNTAIIHTFKNENNV